MGGNGKSALRRQQWTLQRLKLANGALWRLLTAPQHIRLTDWSAVAVVIRPQRRGIAPRSAASLVMSTAAQSYWNQHSEALGRCAQQHLRCTRLTSITIIFADYEDFGFI